MASSIPEEVKQDLLECKICFEVMEKPKVLHCLHTFCEGCIEDLFQKLGQKNEINCPVCRNVTTLPPGGAKSLRANFLINTLQDALGKSEKIVKCEFCDKSCSFMCLDCNDKMCSSHGSHHCSTKFTREHKVVSMDDVKAGKYAKEILAYQFIECSKHPGKGVEFYCKECEMMLCVSCKILNHEGHKCLSLEEAGKSKMEAIKDTLSKMADANQILKCFKSELENAQITLDQDKANIETTIDGIADKMYKEIRRQQAELKMQLESIYKSQTKVYQLEKEEIEMNIASINSGIEFGETLMKHGRPIDGLSFAEQVESNVNGIMSSFNEKCQQVMPQPIQKPQYHGRRSSMRTSRQNRRFARSYFDRFPNDEDDKQIKTRKSGIILSFQENHRITNFILHNRQSNTTEEADYVDSRAEEPFEDSKAEELFGNLRIQDKTVQIHD